MLSQEEKQGLEKLLQQAVNPEQAFNMPALEGFLYGVVITPTVFDPNEWLPEVFGEDLVKFEDENQEKELVGWMSQAYSRLYELRIKGELTFPFDVENLSEEQFLDLDDWVFGFHQALLIRPQIWQIEEHIPEEPSEDEVERLASYGVVLGLSYPEDAPELFMDDEGRMAETPEEEEELFAHLYTSLPVAVATLQAYGAEVERQATSLDAGKKAHTGTCGCSGEEKGPNCCGQEGSVH